MIGYSLSVCILLGFPVTLSSGISSFGRMPMGVGEVVCSFLFEPICI